MKKHIQSFESYVKSFQENLSTMSISDEELEAVKNWVVDDFNASGFGYNPDANVNVLLRMLKTEAYRGKIFRVVSIPRIEYENLSIQDVKSYIWEKGKDRYSSFSVTMSGVNYFMPYVRDKEDRAVIISQVSWFYDLSEWYNKMSEQLEEIYQNDRAKYWWINENLPEVENTQECIAMLDENFKIEKVL